MKRIITLFAVVASMLVCSCGKELKLETYDGLYKEPLLSWGASIDEIKAVLGEPSLDQSPSSINYDYDRGCFLIYWFEDGGLSEVDVVVQDRNVSFEDLDKHLRGKYVYTHSYPDIPENYYTFADGTGEIRLISLATDYVHRFSVIFTP